MTALKRYLEKLLNLPGLSWFTLGAGALFVFSGWPMLGSYIEKLIPWLTRNDTEPWAGQDYYLCYFLGTFFLFMIGLRHDQNERIKHQDCMVNPPQAPVAVMMASHGEFIPATVEALLACQTPTAFWEALRNATAQLPSGGYPPGSWLGLVFRNIEYHRAALKELVLFYSSDSIWHKEATRLNTHKLLDHWLNLTQDQGAVQIAWRPLNGHGSNLERVRVEVIALQSELKRRGTWATYDLTGGTAAMTGGMVLACVSEAYPLQYFPQGLTGSSDNPLEKSAWKKLPVEKRLGLDAGLWPLLVDTDADAVVSATVASQG